MPVNPSLLAPAFTPADWYWKADSGRFFGSARGGLLTDPTSDADFLSWQSARGHGPTSWPRDTSGQQTDASLAQVLTANGLVVTGYEAVPASVSSAQAKIQLLKTPGAETGKTLLDDVTAAVQAEGGEAAIWFSEARTWQRDNPYVASLSASLKLTAQQVDALFIAAAKISA